VAWHHLGWEAQWFSEIEHFPSEVLKYRFPAVENLGDMTKLTANEKFKASTIDLLVGGTPCQSFSVAGLRGGLADPRGNLMLTFLSLADAKKPRWIVWENVPGVLSSNGGKDFGTFLGALGELGYGFAYRVLDAQHFGVAQRRRRVFVVGYLGDWRVAAAVLFERESLSGDLKPSRKKGKEITSDVEGGVGEAGSWWDGSQVAGTLTKQNANGAQRMPDKDNFGAILQQPFRKVRRAQSDSDFETWEKDETANTLNCFDVGDVRSTNVVAQPIAVDWRTAQVDQGIAQTLKTDLAKMSGPCVAVDTYNYTTNDHTTQTIRSQSDTEHIAVDVYNQSIDGQTSATITEAVGGTNTSGPKVMHSMAIRRLTVKECERLQGFPDDWTKIPYRNKPADQCPDGPRYKACGNSMAVPVMRWIGERIQLIDTIVNG
jgi:DNA (cytosine-5)-methyltransferase 1